MAALKKKNSILLTAAVLCLISLILMMAVLCAPKEQTGEFIPPSFDSAAHTGTPTVPDGLGWQELDAKAYKVGVCGKIIPNGNIADVWLYNSTENTVWLKLRVLDANGNTLGETGLIRPGEYVQSVTLHTVPETGTPIVLKIMAYQQDTYYSEGAVTLNTAIGGRS